MTPEILIVEDDADLGICLAATLKRKQYSVTLAASGEEAIAWLSEGHKVDLILSDFVMREVDGLALLKFVRDRDPRLPHFILMTGQGRINAQEAKALGAQEFYVKPFHIPALLESIHKLVYS